MNTSLNHRPVVSRDAWNAARQELLAREKSLSQLCDEISRERRALPWVRVEKPYHFMGPAGPCTLADLFDGRSQLLVYHFMFGPTWDEGCPSCSYVADHFDGMIPHLKARDVSLVAVSRAPLARFQGFKQRLGWQFPWYSSAESDFNFDYHVSFTPEQLASGEVEYNYTLGPVPSEELPGISAFYKDEAGTIFHTYSSYARGLDLLVGTYNYLDLVPKGRDEDGLKFSMAWVRYHDRYEHNYLVDVNQLYSPPQGSPCANRAAEGVV